MFSLAGTALAEETTADGTTSAATLLTGDTTSQNDTSDGESDTQPQQETEPVQEIPADEESTSKNETPKTEVTESSEITEEDQDPAGETTAEQQTVSEDGESAQQTSEEVKETSEEEPDESTEVTSEAAEETQKQANTVLGAAPAVTTEAESQPQEVATLADDAGTTTEAELSAGVNVISSGAQNMTYNIGDGQVVMISNQHADDDAPIVFTNCTFILAGGTVKISGAQQEENEQPITYNNGETVTKLWIGGNVQFNNCTFVTAEGATKTTSAGYDAAIYFFGGNIGLKDCNLTAEGYNGQFLGLYGNNGAVTFDHCNIATVNNKNGWSYAMYGGSVLKLVNDSTMTATGMTTDSGNINAFYSGDNRTGYDAIFVENSKIDFSDNKAGGFAINNVNIHVDNSEIIVNNNLGNACNSGYWIVNNSTIQMNGNRGGHALSCIGFEMTDSTLEILHNGYAGVYIQSKNSSLTNCTVDVRCNGEKLLSYSAGDVWLNGHTLTVSGGTSKAMEGSPWLGAVGRKGSVRTIGTTAIVAYDLNSNAADNLKSNTAPVFGDAQLTETDEHILFLNPFMKTSYARGNAEGTASNNDADLFKDDHVQDRTDIIGKDNAEIGALTEAQLAHHKYDWNSGKVTDDATPDTFGVKRFACTDVCDAYTGNTTDHVNSFDCDGTYVYAPLVGLEFDANLPADVAEDAVQTPEAQTQIDYQGTGTEPEALPTIVVGDMQYVFTGWYTDADCTDPFDFASPLTANWTTVYAGWRSEPVTTPAPEQPATPDPGDTTTPDPEQPATPAPEQPATPAPGVTTTPAPVDKDEHPEIAQAIQDGTWGATPTPTAAPANHVPQTSDDFPYALCIVLVLVAAGGLGAVVYGKKHNLF